MASVIHQGGLGRHGRQGPVGGDGAGPHERGDSRATCTGETDRSKKLVTPDQVEAWLDKLSDERWDALFAKSHDVLSSLAAQAQREDEAGLTVQEDIDSWQ